MFSFIHPFIDSLILNSLLPSFMVASEYFRVISNPQSNDSHKSWPYTTHLCDDTLEDRTLMGHPSLQPFSDS